LSDPIRQKAYQPFGDLRLHFAGQGQTTDYRRELDLDDAMARTTFRLGDVRFQRDVFASHPDQAVVMRITADHPGNVSFTLKMDSPHTNSQTRAIALDTLALTGQVASGGLRFESRARVVCDGGTVTTNQNILAVQNANAATLFLVSATGFKNFQDVSADPAKGCARDLAAVGRKSFDAVLAAHLADYHDLFRRVSVDFGRTPRADLPNDQRLQSLKQAGLEGDPALAALYFQYGRYLLISSSRPGEQVDSEHQLRDELLARRIVQFERMRPATVRHD
jgi:alpha-L-fucosidase 2